MLGGGGIAVPDNAVVGGGGMAEHDSEVVGGGGIAVPASAVLGAGVIAEHDSAVVGGAGMGVHDSAMTGGGGMTEGARAPLEAAELPGPGPSGGTSGLWPAASAAGPALVTVSIDTMLRPAPRLSREAGLA